MSPLVLDTNIVSYVMKGHSLAELYRAHLEGSTAAVSFMTVAELYEGAYRARWGRKKLARLESVLRSYLVIPSSPELCRRWGQIRTERRKQPISCEDAWIAATALAHASPLVTHNPDDFTGLTGLQIITEKRD